MSEARNVYPRLCWGCLGVIEDYTHDHALLNHGGYCTDCHMSQDGEMPGLRYVLRGHHERMNNVSERDELLREVKMNYGRELATGGVIENAPLMGRESGCEYLVRDVPLRTSFWPKLSQEQEAAVTEFLSAAVDKAAEDIQALAYGRPRAEFVPSNAFSTREELRAFVDERIHAVLYPDEHGIVDAGQQRRIRQFDEDGTEWRGVLYRVRKEE